MEMRGITLKHCGSEQKGVGHCEVCAFSRLSGPIRGCPSHSLFEGLLLSVPKSSFSRETAQAAEETTSGLSDVRLIFL